MHRAEARRETGTEEREVSGIVSQVVERGYISSGSGFALIASLELRFLEFRQASPIVSPPPELRPTPHRAGWTHTGYTERVSGEIHACSRVRSHGMLDRSNHVARSHRSSLPFALLLPRHYVCGEGKKMKGERICRYDTRLKELSRHVRGGGGM